MKGPTAGVSIRNLSFGYRPETPVIPELSSDFSRGCLTAVTGPSGSGKSTLLYLLALMVRPTSGEIWIKDERVDCWSEGARADLRARNFGFLFQDAILDPSRTILDNTLETVLYRRSNRRHEISRALALLERLGVADRPGDRPGQLSGGQAQRVALCRALLAAPAVLLADEPTGNLDAASGAIVVDALRDHADSGATVIIATHDPAVLTQCDTVMELG